MQPEASLETRKHLSEKWLKVHPDGDWAETSGALVCETTKLKGEGRVRRLKAAQAQTECVRRDGQREEEKLRSRSAGREPWTPRERHLPTGILWKSCTRVRLSQPPFKPALGYQNPG